MQCVIKDKKISPKTQPFIDPETQQRIAIFEYR